MTKGTRTAEMRTAVVVQFVSNYAGYAIRLVMAAVLSRLLAPSDYGVVAIVSVFTEFFLMLSDSGIGVAIVQYRDLTEEDYGSLFGFTVVLGVALSVLLCLAAQPIAAFYADARLAGVCRMSALTLFLSTVNMVPNGLLLKARRFTSVGVRHVVASLASGIVAVALALSGWGYYSLVLQSAATQAMVLTWNLIASPIRHPSFKFVSALRKVFRYSAFQFGFNAINYFSRNLDNLLIGKFMGAAPLAYYDKAYKLSIYPVSAFSNIIGSVVQPFMAEHQDDRAVIFENWMRVQKVISLAGALITAVCLCFCEEIIVVLFGGQWGPSVPLFRMLALSIYARMANNVSGAYFQSLGRTDLMFQTGVVTTCLSVACIVCGIELGSALWVARLVALSSWLQLVIVVVQLVMRAFGVRATRLASFLPEIATAVVACTLCGAVSQLSLAAPARLLCEAALLGGCFALGYGLTGQWSFLKQALRVRRGNS